MDGGGKKEEGQMGWRKEEGNGTNRLAEEGGENGANGMNEGRERRK